MRVHIDRDLIEETVHAAMARHPDAAAFHRERERCYEGRVEDRDARFGACFQSWFDRLGLGRAIDAALCERPAIAEQIAQARMSATRRRKDQGVELFVAPPQAALAERDRRLLHARVLASVLADPQAALAMLRPELLHVADMLDPEFGYRPELPPAQSGPTQDRMLLDRYSALWTASVVGRLVSEGLVGAHARQRSAAQLAAVFPMHAERVEETFGFLLDGARPAHDDLVTIALDPRSLAECSGGNGHPHRCSLCGCPTSRFEPAVRLSGIVDAIRAHVPTWNPADPVCPQCADLCRVGPSVSAA
jgi:hypothetical protein